MTLLRRQIRNNMLRIARSYRLVISIISAVAILVISNMQNYESANDVLELFYLMQYGLVKTIIVIPISYVYGDCFCKDVEHRYINYELIRSNIKSYVFSKTITIFIGAILTTVSTVIIYIAIISIIFPLFGGESQYYQILLQNGGMRYLLQCENIWGYVTMWAIQYGLLMGMTSVVSSFFALLIKNRAMSIAMPYFLLYYLEILTERASKGSVGLIMIFSACNNLFNDDVLSFIVPVIIAIVISVFFSELVVVHLRRNYI